MNESRKVRFGVVCTALVTVLLAVTGVRADEVLPLNVALGEQAVELSNPGLFEAQVSSYQGAIRSFRLMEEQFVQKQRDVPAGVVRPPDQKLAPGPLDLVTTWDVTYYPYSIHFDQKVERLTGAPIIKRKMKSDPRHPVKEGEFESLFLQDPIFTVIERSPDEVRMVWPDPNEDESTLFIERTWRIIGDYLLAGDVRLINLSDQEITGRLHLNISAWDSLAKSGGAGCGMMMAAPPDNKYVLCMVGEELEEVEQRELVGLETGLGIGASFLGVNSRYFLMAALPKSDVPVQCVGAGNVVGSFAAVMQWERFRLKDGADTCLPTWMPARGPLEGRITCADAEKMLQLTGEYDVAALGTAYTRAVARATSEPERDALERAKNALLPGRSKNFPFDAFIGPKFIDELEEVGSGLDETIDFWVLGFLARPMLWILRTSYDMVPSYGLAIIILTLLVKLITLYPTQKSMQQMKRMGDLKPKMDELREKFKGDKTKLNEAMMALYKREKVNPLGGCLPMLLQMPIWIALYRTIWGAVDLYQMPLFLWIEDLSAPDPYYVMPVLLGALMFLQQKMTPVMGDQTQAKVMMYMMPIMFTVFMWFLPSGLVFYILVNTILAIGHQWYVRRPTKAAAGTA
ncbi:MAG: YidC/Oxa1 family insertase periplasmic-domain containing protein [Deltaproteobacteria bacterium]|nr:YidC/Oxa1 family insertase periplasmic-domain containing protein [Deltaproteobacteria bacterium]